MKGMIFCFLEQHITESWGKEKFSEILADCPFEVRGTFNPQGTYPSADLVAIVGKMVEKFGVSLPEALRGFGRFCFPKLVAAYPAFVVEHHNAKTYPKGNFVISWKACVRV